MKVGLYRTIDSDSLVCREQSHGLVESCAEVVGRCDGCLGYLFLVLLGMSLALKSCKAMIGRLQVPLKYVNLTNLREHHQ